MSEQHEENEIVDQTSEQEEIENEETVDGMLSTAHVVSTKDVLHLFNELESFIEKCSELSGAKDEDIPFDVRMEQLYQIREFADHAATERTELAKQVEILQQDKAFYKAKAAQQGEAAVNADRANLRRVIATVVQMLRGVKVAPAVSAPNGRRGAIGKFNRGQVSAVPEDPNFTAIQTIQRAKDLLENAMTGNRRRKYVNAASPRKVKLEKTKLPTP